MVPEIKPGSFVKEHAEVAVKAEEQPKKGRRARNMDQGSYQSQYGKNQAAQYLKKKLIPDGEKPSEMDEIERRIHDRSMKLYTIQKEKELLWSKQQHNYEEHSRTPNFSTKTTNQSGQEINQTQNDDSLAKRIGNKIEEKKTDAHSSQAPR